MHLLDWLKLKKLTIPNADEDVEQQELLFIAGGNAEWVCSLWKTVWHVLTELRIVLPCDPAVTLLDIYLN